MTQISRKAGDYPARKAITDQGDDPPFDPARLEILAKVFEHFGGVNVEAFRSAIASGNKPTYGAALVDALNEFITAAPTAPAPAQRPMPGIMTQHDAPARKEADQYRKIANQLFAPPPWVKGPSAA
jgi:hypothetical protein